MRIDASLRRRRARPRPRSRTLHVNGKGVVVAGGPVRRALAWVVTVVTLAASSSPPALSEASESHEHSYPSRATRDRSGLTRPVGHRDAVAGRRPSCPSRIRVERATTRGAAARGARCPAAAGEAPGQVCAAGPSRPVRASPKGGWVGSSLGEPCASRVRTENSDHLRFIRAYIRGSSELSTLLALHRS